MSCLILPLLVQVISGGHCCVFVVALPSSQTGQRPLQLQSSIGAQEDVEEGIQQGVEARQTVAEAVDEEN